MQINEKTVNYREKNMKIVWLPTSISLLLKVILDDKLITI